MLYVYVIDILSTYRMPSLRLSGLLQTTWSYATGITCLVSEVKHTVYQLYFKAGLFDLYYIGLYSKVSVRSKTLQASDLALGYSKKNIFLTELRDSTQSFQQNSIFNQKYQLFFKAFTLDSRTKGFKLQFKYLNSSLIYSTQIKFKTVTDNYLSLHESNLLVLLFPWGFENSNFSAW